MNQEIANLLGLLKQLSDSKERGEPIPPDLPQSLALQLKQALIRARANGERIDPKLAAFIEQITSPAGAAPEPPRPRPEPAFTEPAFTEAPAREGNPETELKRDPRPDYSREGPLAARAQSVENAEGLLRMAREVMLKRATDALAEVEKTSPRELAEGAAQVGSRLKLATRRLARDSSTVRFGLDSEIREEDMLLLQDLIDHAANSAHRKELERVKEYLDELRTRIGEKAVNSFARMVRGVTGNQVAVKLRRPEGIAEAFESSGTWEGTISDRRASIERMLEKAVEEKVNTRRWVVEFFRDGVGPTFPEEVLDSYATRQIVTRILADLLGHDSVAHVEYDLRVWRVGLLGVLGEPRSSTAAEAVDWIRSIAAIAITWHQRPGPDARIYALATFHFGLSKLAGLELPQEQLEAGDTRVLAAVAGAFGNELEVAGSKGPLLAALRAYSAGSPASTLSAEVATRWEDGLRSGSREVSDAWMFLVTGRVTDSNELDANSFDSFLRTFGLLRHSQNVRPRTIGSEFFNCGVNLLRLSQVLVEKSADSGEGERKRVIRELALRRALVNALGLYWCAESGDTDIWRAWKEDDGVDCSVNLYGALIELFREAGEGLEEVRERAGDLAKYLNAIMLQSGARTTDDLRLSRNFERLGWKDDASTETPTLQGLVQAVEPLAEKLVEFSGAEWPAEGRRSVETAVDAILRALDILHERIGPPCLSLVEARGRITDMLVPSEVTYPLQDLVAMYRPFLETGVAEANNICSEPEWQRTLAQLRVEPMTVQDVFTAEKLTDYSIVGDLEPEDLVPHQSTGMNGIHS